MRAVSRANLMQLAACALHHVRHAEGAADFHEFATRNDHFSAKCDGAEREQYGGSVVVHHCGGFSPSEVAQQPFDVQVALTARADIDVELQVHGAGHSRQRRFHRRFRENGPTQVGVQHGPAEVDDAAKRRKLFAR